jgi:hypothetical protein
MHYFALSTQPSTRYRGLKHLTELAALRSYCTGQQWKVLMKSELQKAALTSKEWLLLALKLVGLYPEGVPETTERHFEMHYEIILSVLPVID